MHFVNVFNIFSNILWSLFQGCILVARMCIVTLCTRSVQRFWESTDLRLDHIHFQRYLNQNSTLQRRYYNVKLFAGLQRPGQVHGGTSSGVRILPNPCTRKQEPASTVRLVRGDSENMFVTLAPHILLINMCLKLTLSVLSLTTLSTQQQ